MLESLNTNVFEYEKLKPEEMQRRGILGRLVGIMADTVNPTRNGRSYSGKLWENVFNNPIMKERIENNCCFGELGHPTDREETDMTKIAICMDGMPKKDKDGKLQAVFNILDTPNGRILKSLCDYGCNIGISSRGSGDLITDFDGNESVDPDTYNCEGWDAVIIPAVKEARLTYVTEALDKKRYNKSLRSKLQETIDKETEDNKKVMTESLYSLGIRLNEDVNEDISKDNIEIPKEEVKDENDFFYKGVEIIKDPDSGKFVCEIEGDSYSFNTEKNAKLWVDINVKETPKKSTLIKDLAYNTQKDIEKELSKVVSDEDVKRGMAGRLSDLEDTIDIKKYLKEEQVGRDNIKDDKNVDDVMKPETEEETSTEEDKKEDNKVTITISEANGNDPHTYVKLEKPYRALIFDNGEISISSIRPYDDGDYYYANYNGNSEGIFHICQNGKVKEKIKVDMSDKTFKDVVNRLKELDSKINPRMLYDSLNESLDWTDLNGTEQSSVEAVIHKLENGEYRYLEDLELDCNSAVNMYNEANAFDEYADEEFYEEEGDPKKVYEYIINAPHYKKYVDKLTPYKSITEDVEDITVARIQLKQLLDDWYEENIANELSSDLKEAGWDSELQDRYLDFRNYLTPDFIHIEEESMGDVDNIEAEIDSLQEMLNYNKTLEKQIIELNEKLSVSHAMEKSLKAELRESKDKISALSKTSKENKILTEQLTAAKDSAAKLNESKKENVSKIKSLKEKLDIITQERDTQGAELSTLKEDYDILSRDLNQTKEQFSKKFEKQNQLLEKYQKITKNAVDRYINMQATNLGVRPVEIKNRLSESFTFNDIDSVCEDLRDYKLNVSKLPFNTSNQLNEGVEVKVNNVNRNSLLPRNEVDELTDYDLKLMEAYL